MPVQCMLQPSPVSISQPSLSLSLTCHKCILDARLQYFHGLFSSTWIEVVMFVYNMLWPIISGTVESACCSYSYIYIADPAV